MKTTKQEDMIENAIVRAMDAAFAFIEANRDVTKEEVTDILDKQWSLGRSWDFWSDDREAFNDA